MDFDLSILVKSLLKGDYLPIKKMRVVDDDILEIVKKAPSLKIFGVKVSISPDTAKEHIEDLGYIRFSANQELLSIYLYNIGNSKGEYHYEWG